MDVTPEELLDRLKAGKVYVPAQAERALANFFHMGNLVALRELSLRQTANRLHRDVEAARHDRAATAPWATTERLLVCVGPSPTSAKIIRSCKRMAAAFGADWLAVAVDTAKESAGLACRPASSSLVICTSRKNWAARRRLSSARTSPIRCSTSPAAAT